MERGKKKVLNVLTKFQTISPIGVDHLKEKGEKVGIKLILA